MSVKTKMSVIPTPCVPTLRVPTSVAAFEVTRVMAELAQVFFDVCCFTSRELFFFLGGGGVRGVILQFCGLRFPIDFILPLFSFSGASCNFVIPESLVP